MTDPAQRRRDEAREDLAAYHRWVVLGRTDEAAAIEQKWDLAGLPPRLVSLGLQAASEGRDPPEAVQRARTKGAERP